MFTPLPTLRRLCAAYDRMGKDSLIVDFRRMERWYEAAERAVEGSFATARNNGMVRTALCRCLTCYFYLSHAERDDEWYAYLTQTADEWTASLTPEGLWEDITIPEALERIEVMNRISYMLLDHSRDADIRRVYNCYAKRIHNLSKHWNDGTHSAPKETQSHSNPKRHGKPLTGFAGWDGKNTATLNGK